MKKLNFNVLFNNKLLLCVMLFLVLITLLTSYYGSTDTGDYADSAKFFSGHYSAKTRSSHSYLLGFVHSPFIKLTNSFIGFKITSLIFLFLIIYSVYYISKSKKALVLAVFSPIIWYLAPWISPIQIASLFLLWAYYFIDRYDRSGRISFLIYSGILIGLGWAVWDSILFLGIILAITFLFNKKFYHLLYFLVAVLIGLAPRLLLDVYLFNFPFYTIFKSTFGTFSNFLAGGIYGYSWGGKQKNIVTFLSVIIAFPLYSWIIYKKDIFGQNKKTVIFLSLSVLLLLFAIPHPRYALALVPIILLLISEKLSERQFKIQIIYSLIIALLFITPYLIQINYSVVNEPEGVEFSYLLKNKFSLDLDKKSFGELIQEDIESIVSEYPNQTFVVGNNPDDYQVLAHFYWGRGVREFVSIQDYGLYLNNQSVLFEKTFMPVLNIPDRRQIWISGGISKNQKDSTDYDSLSLGIGINNPLNLDNFGVVKKYNILYLSQKLG